MIFSTERLQLRPLNVDDLQTVREYASDPENTRYMMFFPKTTEEETRTFLLDAEAEWQKEAPDFYEFAIVLEHRQIGAVTLYMNETRTQGELGWILNKRYWNHGYVTEAAQAVVDFARDTLQLEAVIAQCDSRNKASARVMEKLGMALLVADGTRTYPKTNEVSGEFTYILRF